MSESKQQSTKSEAPRRRSQSLSLKPLDFERRFIDDLIARDARLARYNAG